MGIKNLATGHPLSRGPACAPEARRITADTAVRLTLFSGNSPEFWMNLQTRYDLKLARRNLKEADVEKIRSKRVA